MSNAGDKRKKSKAHQLQQHMQFSMDRSNKGRTSNTSYRPSSRIRSNRNNNSMNDSHGDPHLVHLQVPINIPLALKNMNIIYNNQQVSGEWLIKYRGSLLRRTWK
jgi:hypothetical protein